MADAPSVRESVLRLLTNWGKGTVSARMIDQWVEVAEDEGYSAEEFRQGVDACIRNWPDKFAPQGIGNVLAYMPTRRTAKPRAALPYWGKDGGWGGDWSDVPLRRWLTAAATFTAEMRPSRVAVRVEGAGPRGEKTVTESAILRDTMDESTKARCEAFLRLARRRLSHEEIDAAAKACEAGHLGRFVDAWWEARRGARTGVLQEGIFPAEALEAHAPEAGVAR